MAYTARKDSYQCKTCGEVFTSPQLLGAHNRYTHPKKRKIGRPLGTKNSKPRKTLVRVGLADDPIVAAPAPIRPRYEVNFCPNCSCPLHGAREGLSTEQEMRAGQ